MVGKRARAIAAFSQTGQVECEGITYTATSDRPVKKGEQVIITSVSGIKLSVTPHTNPNTHQ
jgi:membrane protein implicated in regulation of membrane protease activity